MAAAQRIENADGDVMHIRVPPDMHDSLRRLASIHGRSITQELLYHLDVALYGPRELRLLKGKLGEN